MNGKSIKSSYSFSLNHPKGVWDYNFGWLHQWQYKISKGNVQNTTMACIPVTSVPSFLPPQYKKGFKSFCSIIKYLWV